MKRIKCVFLFLGLMLFLSGGAFLSSVKAEKTASPAFYETFAAPVQPFSDEHTIPGEWLVRLRKPTERSGLLYDNNHVMPDTIQMGTDEKTMLLKVPPDRAAAAVEELRNNPNVEYIEPNYIYKVTQAVTEAVYFNDPLYPEQWGLRSIQAPQAWDKLRNWQQRKKDEVLIAVIDTGMDAGHPEFAGRFVSGINTIEDSPDTTDYNGHGTQVSGIISAAANNSIGLTGAAGLENIKIIPIKAINSAGKGTTHSVVKAIDAAVQMGADIINLSLSGNGNSRIMRESIVKAVNKGILVVAAAGNHEDHTDGYYPAMYPETLAVSSINEKHETSAFSNYGGSIDLAAPGEHIVTTFLGGTYIYSEGTSLSAPFVSAAAALLKAGHPEWGTAELRATLEQTARDIGSSGQDPYTGHGLIQVSDALSHIPRLGLRVSKPNLFEQVKGRVEFLVEVPPLVSQLKLLKASGEVLTVWEVREGKNTLEWDSLQTGDGDVSLFLQAYDSTGLKAGDPAPVQLYVKNQPASVVAIRVRDEKGEPIHGAIIKVLRLNENRGEAEAPFSPIAKSYTNDQGLCFFPKSMVLGNEKYIVSAAFTDDRLEETYTDTKELAPDMEEIGFDFSKMRLIQVGTSLQGSWQTHVSYTFVPQFFGVEATELAVNVAHTDADRRSVKLSEGTYRGYAVRNEPDGANLILRHAFTIDRDTEDLRFQADNARKISVRLPSWALSASWELGESLSGLESPVELTNGGTLRLGNFIPVNDSITLVQQRENELWSYTLSPQRNAGPNDSGVVDIPEQAVLQLGNRPGAQSATAVQPGELVDLAYTVRLGNDYTMTEVKRAGEEVNPEVVFKNKQGQEVWRGTSSGKFYKIPDESTISPGQYSVYLDVSHWPIPFASDSFVQVGDITITSVPKVHVSILPHDGMPYRMTELTVLDGKTGREVFSDSLFHDPGEGSQNRGFDVSGLKIGKPYRFIVRAYTYEALSVYADRQLTIGSNLVTITMNGDSKKVVPLRFNVENKVLFDLAKEGRSVTAFEGDNGGRVVWLDEGTYTMTLIKNFGDRQYYDQRKIKITADMKEYSPVPDFGSMKKVEMKSQQGSGNYKIGIKQKKGGIFNDYFIFSYQSGQELYVGKGDYQFEIVVDEKKGSIHNLYIFEPKPRESSTSYIFKISERFNARLSLRKTGYMPGEEVKGKVSVADSYNNRLKGILQTIHPDWGNADGYFLLSSSAGTRQILKMEDITAQTYKPIGEQSYNSSLKLIHNENVLLEQKLSDGWTSFAFPLPRELKEGKYDLVWTLEEPVFLIKKTKIRLLIPDSSND
ncbi:S8 family serine peptidase [Paenibacillus sp. A3]|uniref:S8 family serine peptidase n=1 Tax=Paenibacillus sp. A3 TaxID=1337054 RepID=UPI0006D5AFCD|nr:S8 family serine peptidase [Paenibacillus sp. A3]